MNKEKLIKCGCGGEAKIYEWTTQDGDGQEIPCWYAYCTNCLIVTDAQFSEAEAVMVWNRAMGSTEKSSTVERTAKVENISDYHLPINDYCFIKKGDCGNCGFTATEGDKYCRECGARLEWE